MAKKEEIGSVMAETADAAAQNPLPRAERGPAAEAENSATDTGDKSSRWCVMGGHRELQSTSVVPQGARAGKNSLTLTCSNSGHKKA